MTSLTLFLFNLSNDTSAVYICVSKTATKYHLSDTCKGLSRCTHKISKVTLKEAKAGGYKLCGWED